MANATAATATATWQLDKFSAGFRTRYLSGSGDLLYPEHGIGAIRVDDSVLEDARLLGLSIPAVSSDTAGSQLEAYTRCGDLVGIYAPTDRHPFRSQVYWRLSSYTPPEAPSGALASLELVASKQTDLLESRPDLTVTSEFPCSQVLRLRDADSEFELIDCSKPITLSTQDGTGCFLFRLRGDKFSYAEMVYPLDFETTELNAVDRSNGKIHRIQHHLFHHRLEKGVILRARVLGLLLRREDDLQTTAAHYALFAVSDPPLTT